ncbi:tRNA(Ile)-lysidine synthase [Roseovarius sp. THAF9]|uniref:tRNA lysidine(34) synthetase TilS n=1 Tax=Roseovarius sp. THAF9 TaxID=2587847 RepID=UPI0012A97B7B|nr:tRNA lysidine(34) synthetase TilS [Roseovarius sp. THAF9]QFT94093.1 tRNA(Ile)-lysidine synthase [Roseovarius sp. THAF9]
MNSPTAHILDQFVATFGTARPKRLGIAVSGGSDSLGLLLLARQWAAQDGPDPYAVTVDHGLRAASRDEAAGVAELCARLDVPHKTLEWRGWDGAGNLPDQARRARYGLIADWAETEQITDVALGHTLNDVAETFVMRLMREAGVDGLAAMAPSWRQGAVEFRRPLLQVSRAELRVLVEYEGLAWVDDPTNEDDAFERARVRKALTALEDLGVTARGLGNVARHLGEVRSTLYWYVFLAARNLVSFDRGDVMVECKGFRTLPRDICRRMVQEILRWISGADYGPRGKAVDLMLEAISGGNGMTLHGVMMSVGADQLRFSREPKAVAQVRTAPGEAWDGRWQLDGPWPDGAEVAALGEAGLAQCAERVQPGLPRASLLASPAVWRGGHLVAAPLAGFSEGWTATLLRDEDMFFASILAH